MFITLTGVGFIITFLCSEDCVFACYLDYCSRRLRLLWNTPRIMFSAFRQTFHLPSSGLDNCTVWCNCWKTICAASSLIPKWYIELRPQNSEGKSTWPLPVFANQTVLFKRWHSLDFVSLKITCPAVSLTSENIISSREHTKQNNTLLLRMSENTVLTVQASRNSGVLYGSMEFSHWCLDDFNIDNTACF